MFDMLPSLKGVTVTRTFETTTWGTTLHASGTDVVAAHGRVVVQVDAALPLHSALLDVAFPGTHLAGATMADLTVVDLSRHRRTLHAEVPAHLTVTGTIALALSPVIPPRTTSSRSVARTVTA
ncbi:hypothetical protein CYJ73_14355 [Gordonia terrae]|uniref:Uncharacterized protein n=1 Tax=Gordonia terrae TaxID=2055 RepID=A0A2I1R739_9ACTN|nr:hypothetical protein CYJ73_14355 [Gordonia terrae]